MNYLLEEENDFPQILLERNKQKKLEVAAVGMT
jgi:hypothetical protein